MTLFVHLTPQKNIKSILHNGIKKLKFQKGVFALPVVQNYFVSHQWLRELGRWRNKNFVAVYFRIDDDEPVFFRYYSDEFIEMKAVEAEAVFYNIQFNPQITEKKKRRNRGANDELPLSPLGYEAVIPRKISQKEILRVGGISQMLGWRFFPYSNGNRPVICLGCERGAFGIRKIERQVKKERLKGQLSKVTLFSRH